MRLVFLLVFCCLYPAFGFSHFDYVATGTRCDSATGTAAITTKYFGVGPYTYSKDGINFSSDSIITQLGEGGHGITVKDATGHSEISYVHIEYLSEPEIYFNVIDKKCSNSPGSIELNQVFNAEMPYELYYDSVLSESGKIENLEEGAYYAALKDAYGCWGTADLQIHNDCVDIAQGFSPNGDGINDTWDIAKITRFSNNIVKVFSRHGHLVFRSEGYTEPWDGRSFGMPLPIGTYYYHIQLDPNDASADEFTGWVAIVK